MGNFISKLAKVFGISTRPSPLKPDHSMPPSMDDVAFWYIVERCNDLTASNERYYNTLWSILDEVDDVAVAGFAVKIEELRKPLRSWDNWAAASFIFPGLPHQAHHGFQNWIISSGKGPYLQAVEQADNIVDVIAAAGHRELVFDIFNRIPAEILSTRSGCAHLLEAMKGSPNENVLHGECWELTDENFEIRFPRLSEMINRDPEVASRQQRPILH